MGEGECVRLSGTGDGLAGGSGLGSFAHSWMGAGGGMGVAGRPAVRKGQHGKGRAAGSNSHEFALIRIRYEFARIRRYHLQTLIMTLWKSNSLEFGGIIYKLSL